MVKIDGQLDDQNDGQIESKPLRSRDQSYSDQ